MRVPLLFLALAAGCAGGESSRTARSDSTAATDSAPGSPPDALVLTAPEGVEVWFTASRTGTDSQGRTCTERVMEIRRDGRRIPVPLLYTGEPPTPVDDSTIHAHIWLGCRPGNLYSVNLRTGHPTRVAP